MKEQGKKTKKEQKNMKNSSMKGLRAPQMFERSTSLGKYYPKRTFL